MQKDTRSDLAMSIPIRFPLMGLLFFLALAAGCAFDPNMRDQPRVDPLDASTVFADGASARPRVEGSVARGELRTDAHFYTGRGESGIAETFPFTVTLDVLERGRERYEIFCTPCHGASGEGDGPVIDYGYDSPTSLHDPELQERQFGYYFAIISNGTRVMPGYAARIPPEDRWAIVAYVRALQMGHSDDLSEMPLDELPSRE